MQIKGKWPVLVLLIFILCINNLYAQEAEQKNYVGAGVAGLVAVANTGTMPGVGASLGWNNPHLFMNLFGIGAYVNFLFGFADNVEGDTNTGLVASVLVGPSIMAFQSGTFSLPVTLGYHFNLNLGLGDGVGSAINMGIGVAADAVYQLNNRWNVFGRLTAIYNFAAEDGEFILIPVLGAGLKF
jgi:hypothetical protein